MALSDARRRNPLSRRCASLSRPDAGPLTPPPGYPPARTIERWRKALLADDAFRSLQRPDPEAARRRLHAWWSGLDFETCSPREVADVWAWRREEAQDPPPARGWDELLRAYGGDREALRADLAAEIAERGLGGPAAGAGLRTSVRG